jgi:uncharacterized protein
MLYLDTSAFLKLLVDEEHSHEVRSMLERSLDSVWSSTLLDVEAHRAARRLGVPADVVADHLETVTLFALGESTLVDARTVGPDTLRTLDALHLAAALELGADLEAVVTYDRRLAAGCASVECPVVAPGLADGWWEETRGTP